MGIALARAGAEVILVGRNPENAIDKLAAIDAFGGKSWFHKADVSKRQEIDDLLTAVLLRSGKVDILVNGAGLGSATPFLEITEEELTSLDGCELQKCLPCLPDLRPVLRRPP